MGTVPVASFLSVKLQGAMGTVPVAPFFLLIPPCRDPAVMEQFFQTVKHEKSCRIRNQCGSPFVVLVK